MKLEMEVSVGDVLRIGDYTVVVVDLHDDEVTFKICSENEFFDEPISTRPLMPR